MDAYRAALEAAGGVNAVTAIFEGPPSLSIEALLKIDPDIILIVRKVVLLTSSSIYMAEAVQDAVDAAEAESDQVAARDLLLTRVVDMAVTRRQLTGVLQFDPVKEQTVGVTTRFRITAVINCSISFFNIITSDFIISDCS